GWLRWSDALAPAPPRPGGKGPIALRVHLGPVGQPHPGFDLTEAGTQKRLAAYLTTDPATVPGIAKLGPDALALDAASLAAIMDGRTERLKTMLTDQSLVAGIGNAYSDEILHVARLSPYAIAGRLDGDAVQRLAEAVHTVLTEAVARSV